MSDRDASAAVAAAHRDHWAAVLAATAATVRDLDLAEDAAQEAFAQALPAWERHGTPAHPAAWLTTAAKRRAVDAQRRERTLHTKLPLLIWDRDPAIAGSTADPRVDDEESPAVLDDQLRLVFLCAHPALAPEARVALTLRLVTGMTTADIAAVFLVPQPTMAARLTRAKKRIALSRIPCRVPSADELPARVTDVLDVVSVMLAAGHDAPSGEAIGRHDLLNAGIRLLELLTAQLPATTEPVGLLAQALLLRARTTTRTDQDGLPVALADQDRSRWDRGLIDRADGLLIDALRRGGRGPYLLQGAIAAALCVPARHQDIDHDEVVELYDRLLEHWPTPVVRLNRAVARAQTSPPAAHGADGTGTHLREVLAEVDALAVDLAGYRQLHVVRGELLHRVGQDAAAVEAYREALRCPGNEADALLLRQRIGAAQR